MITAIDTYKGFLEECSDANGAKAWCERFSKSAFCPAAYKGKPEDIYFACAYGAQMGLSPVASVTGIAVINGRPTIYGDALKGLVIGHCTNFVEEFDDATWTATCKIWRKGYSMPTEARFSLEDAKQAGLANKGGPWKMFPKRMLQMRARGYAIRDAFPDILNGIITREEAEDYVSIEPASVSHPVYSPGAPTIEPDEVVSIEPDKVVANELPIPPEFTS